MPSQTDSVISALPPVPFRITRGVIKKDFIVADIDADRRQGFERRGDAIGSSARWPCR
jgi:hypothetical protein